MTNELKKEWNLVLDFPAVYIYGAAKTAEKLYDFFLELGYKGNIKGFLVTDGERNVKMLHGLPVSDIHIFADKGIRVLVPHIGVYKEQISNLLDELGFKNVFLIGRLQEKTALEERKICVTDCEKAGWKEYYSKPESEKVKDVNIREQILNILQEEQPDFGGVKPYQSMELIGLEGIRPTEYRIRMYELRQILRDQHDVLDIGCNSGFLDLSIAGLVQSVTGIEYDKSLVKVAKLTAEYLKINNCTFYNDDFNHWLKDADKSYHVIFSFAIHHWLNLSAFEYVKVIDQLLRAGGYFCFESHIYGMDQEFDECYDKFVKLGYRVVCKKKMKDDGLQERMYLMFQKMR